MMMLPGGCPFNQYMQGALPQNYQPCPCMMPQQMAQPLPVMPASPMFQMPVMGNAPFPEDMYTMPAGNAGMTSDPPPILSNNPAITSVVAFKELTGYPNYGNPSGNADILYTGNRGVWSFDIPGNLAAGNFRAQLTIRAVLDDHVNVPVNRYSARITVNGTVVHDGRVPLEHGVPVGGRFTNWRSLPFTIRDVRRNNRIIILNTSTAGPDDWMAFDWMEMRIEQR